MSTTLRFILGDQLSNSISSLEDYIDGDVIWMCEVWDEATYVKHHKKKIAFLFSAMRHFAENLRAKKLNLHYTKLDDPDNAGSFRGEVKRAIQIHKPGKIVVTFPGEYRVLTDIEQWEDIFGIPVEIRQDSRFLSQPDDFGNWAEGRKQLRMEYFYREMRKRYHILMDGDQPVGGAWNYDSQNRKPPKEGLELPPTYKEKPNDITCKCMILVAEKFSDHFGDLEPFHYAVTREGALDALNQFINERLALFGDYQDAMIQGEAWMFHSHISLYLNCGLLEPLEIVQKAEQAYRDQKAPLNAVEGFIRQIIGWREYIRGIYWHRMPEYASDNALNAARTLPRFYWNGETKMNCLRQCILETKENAYAHHIQRLMVLGNFALLCGFDPAQVNAWFLIVYADAYEWVELPNVSGMALFADGGVLASKPYAAGGAYINRMSDYCKGCSYKVTKKNGPEACPFNYLYWDFHIRHQGTLEGNPRLGHTYRTLSKMSAEKTAAIQDNARKFLKALDDGEKI